MGSRRVDGAFAEAEIVDLEEEILASAIGIAVPAVAFTVDKHSEGSIASISAPRFKISNQVIAFIYIVSTIAVIIIYHATIVYIIPRGEIVDSDLAGTDFGSAGKSILAITWHKCPSAHKSGKHLERCIVIINRLMALVDSGEILHIEPVALRESDIARIRGIHNRGNEDVGAPEICILAIGEHGFILICEIGGTRHRRAIARVEICSSVGIGDIGIS